MEETSTDSGIVIGDADVTHGQHLTENSTTNLLPTPKKTYSTALEMYGMVMYQCAVTVSGGYGCGWVGVGGWVWVWVGVWRERGGVMSVLGEGEWVGFRVVVVRVA